MSKTTFEKCFFDIFPIAFTVFLAFIFAWGFFDHINEKLKRTPEQWQEIIKLERALMTRDEYLELEGN